MIFVWDLRNSHAPERVGYSPSVISGNMLTLPSRRSEAMNLACYHSLGVTMTRIFFSPLERTIARFAGTPSQARPTETFLL